MKMPFMLQRIMGDKDAIDRGMEEVKGKIEDLIHQYHDIDMPIICASFKLIVAALEASPIMGEPGRALEENILKNVTAVAIVGPAKKRGRMKNCWICKHRNGDSKGRCAYCASVYDDTGDYPEFEINEELAQAMPEDDDA